MIEAHPELSSILKQQQMVAVKPRLHSLDGTDVYYRRSVDSQELARIKFVLERVKSLTNFMRPHAYMEPAGY